VVVLLLATVATSILGPTAGSTFVVVTSLEGAALFVAQAASRTRAIVMFAIAFLVVVAITLAGVPIDGARRAATVMDGLLLGALALTIVVRIRRMPYVSLQTVLGAVSVYLVLGLLFAVFDSIVSTMTGNQFFTQQTGATTGDYTYFSFITLCTVGYGDLTPSTRIARALAVSEALTGQLYLVTVIAVVVGNLGRSRERAAK
jgi:ion channel